MNRIILTAATGIVAIFFASPALAQRAADHPDRPAADVTESPDRPQPAATEGDAPVTPPGINDKFLDPDLDPEEWVERFEVESREAFAARREVVTAVGLKDGQTIADIGAGTGLYVELFSERVGDEGRVFAVDISLKFLSLIETRAAAASRGNVTPVLGSRDTVRLPRESCNVVFSCDTYHHFEYPGRTLASILAALKPGGRMVVVDFERIEGVSSDWTLGHVRAGKDVVRREIEQAGFRFVAEPEVEGLSENYLLIFEKPGAS